MKKAITVVLAFAMLTTACGKDGTGTTAAEPAASAPATGQGAATPNPATSAAGAPRQLKFEGTTLDGKPFNGTSLGGKPVVMWFWAPWCSKCIAEGPHVAKAATKYGGQVSFVGVGGLDKDTSRLRSFVSRTGTGGFTHLDDRTGKVYAHFRVTTQSSFVFVKPDGTMTRAAGPLEDATLNRRVGDLLR